MSLYEELSEAIVGLTQSMTSDMPPTGQRTLSIIQGAKDWIYTQTGGDLWFVLKGTFSLKESWKSITSGESAVFLLGEAEGFVEGLAGAATFGLWTPDVNLGADWMADQLCVDASLVQVANFTGSVLAIPVEGGVTKLAEQGLKRSVVYATKKVNKRWQPQSGTLAKFDQLKTELFYNNSGDTSSA